VRSDWSKNMNYFLDWEIIDPNYDGFEPRPSQLEKNCALT